MGRLRSRRWKPNTLKLITPSETSPRTRQLRSRDSNETRLDQDILPVEFPRVHRVAYVGESRQIIVERECLRET